MHLLLLYILLRALQTTGQQTVVCQLLPYLPPKPASPPTTLHPIDHGKPSLVCSWLPPNSDLKSATIKCKPNQFLSCDRSAGRLGRFGLSCEGGQDHQICRQRIRPPPLKPRPQRHVQDSQLDLPHQALPNSNLDWASAPSIKSNLDWASAPSIIPALLIACSCFVFGISLAKHKRRRSKLARIKKRQRKRAEKEVQWKWDLWDQVPSGKLRSIQSTNQHAALLPLTQRQSTARNLLCGCFSRRALSVRALRELYLTTEPDTKPRPYQIARVDCAPNKHSTKPHNQSKSY